ncbi:hypothetical protein BG003_006379 [Podila horticola]|nr:hypothetical protein BG003_006379 [Podila horticola]
MTLHRLHYFGSVYNYLDLAAFLLAMAASIYQLISDFRVFQVMCKYLTTVIRVIVEIRVFFMVFALGTPCFEAVPATAATTTDGGRYDPVSKELSEGSNPGLQAMMVIYIFFTVILMLNVLIDNIAFRISLINGGFNHGEGNWRYVCLENRLRYVETAEEMSYHIPKRSRQIQPTCKLRAQVEDLVKKQEETHKPNLRLEEMLAWAVKALEKKG